MADQQLPRSPRFIIIGVQKCGTTAMYDYMVTHSLIRRAQFKETHFWDWKYDWVLGSHQPNRAQQKLLQTWRKESPIDDVMEVVEYVEKTPLTVAQERHLHDAYPLVFSLQTLVGNKSLISGEATPSYLLMGRTVASRIKKHCPKTKLIVCVRDPVARAYS